MTFTDDDNLRLLKKYKHEPSKSPYVEGQCWIFQGAKNLKGYGLFKAKGACHYAHRVMKAICEQRDLSPDEVVLHKCDTPACGNPHHLFLGSVQENVEDMVTKGRHAHGERHGAVKLNVKKVAQIKLAIKMRHPLSKIAERFEISISTVRDIKAGRTWKYVKLNEKETYDPFAETE